MGGFEGGDEAGFWDEYLMDINKTASTTYKNKIKSSILDEISSLKARVESLSKDLTPVANDCSIEKDVRMETIAKQEVTKKLITQSKERLLKLEHALTKLDKPSFGKCIVCSEEIDIDRMLIAPESTKCIECSKV